MLSLLLSILGNSPFVVPPPPGESSVGYQATGACATQVTGDVVCYDNNGAQGGQRDTTTDPDGIMSRPQVCWSGDGTCGAAPNTIYAGQDTTTIAIDGADPSVSCAGDNDTVTVTVYNNAYSSTATILTEGTDWTATASVADTCASLATAVSALAGVSASCTSPDVRVQLDTTTGRVLLAESTAGCTTVATGTSGTINLDGVLSARYNGTQLWDVTSGGVFSIRPTSPPAGTLFAVGSASTANFVINGSTQPRVFTSGAADFGATGASGGGIIAHTDDIYFCGNGPNGATTVYMQPLFEAALYGDAVCDGNDDTTEANSDFVWSPYNFRATSMECGCNDVAVDTGLTFAFRDDTADASTDLTCTTGAGDASGFVSCFDADLTPPVVAAGSAIAMRVVAASGNFSTADCWCRLSITGGN